MTPNRRVVDPLLQRALEVRHALGAAPEPHPLAEVVPALAADAAPAAARDAHLEGDAVPHGEPPVPPPPCALLLLGGWADRHHDPRRLVAERQRRARAQVAVGELLVVRHVRAADARRPHGHLQLARPGLLEDPGFLLKDKGFPVRLA